jgi:hypothetical protein
MTLAKPRVFAKHTRLARINWESALYNGTYILGAKGSGKSTLAADIAFYHFLNETPQFVIDPLALARLMPFYGGSGVFSALRHRICPDHTSPDFGSGLHTLMLPQLSVSFPSRYSIRQDWNGHCWK